MRRLLAALAALALGTPAVAELLDAIVARVDDEVITLSQLRQESKFRSLLGQEGGEGGFEALRRSVVRERLMAREAEKLRLPVPDEAVAAEIAALGLGPAGTIAEGLAASGLAPPDVEGWARRRALAGRFAELRREMTFVAEADLRAWHARYAEALGNAPVDEVRDDLRDYLTQRKNREELAQWLDRQVAEGRVDLIDLPGESLP